MSRVHFSEAKTSGIQLTLGKKPWKLKDNQLIGSGKDPNKKKVKPETSVDQYKMYGYWVSSKFLPKMYVKIIDEKKRLVEFRGLIATGRCYHNNKYNNKYKNKRKSNNSDGCTFITIGYKTGHFIDVTIRGMHKISWCDAVSGKGYIKQYIDGVDYLSIDAFEHKFEKL